MATAPAGAAVPPSPPLPPLSSLLLLPCAEVRMSSLFSVGFGGENCIDGSTETMCATQVEAEDPWMAVRVAAGSPIGYVILHVTRQYAYMLTSYQVRTRCSRDAAPLKSSPATARSSCAVRSPAVAHAH